MRVKVKSVYCCLDGGQEAAGPQPDAVVVGVAPGVSLAGKNIFFQK